MDAARWKLVERLYEEVKDLSGAERLAYLESNHGKDTTLISQVNALFEKQDIAVSFFDVFRQDIFATFEEPEPIESEQHRDSLIGQLIAQYQIQEKLGGGGMGVVYKARDTRLDRDVALKILNTGLDNDDEARRRFITEARAASALSHPNVATIFAIEDILDDRLAIAMMYCEGQSLKERLKKGMMEIDEAVEIGLKVAQGLSAAHQKGIIHRDVKPGNIMMGRENEVRLVDFGLARVSGEARITRTGSAMGTVTYMAPEQAKGAEAGIQADVWSFGVVLFEMLTGQLPFVGEHLHAMIYAVINEEPIPISGLRPGIPDQLAFVVNKAISKNLNIRYKNFEEVIEDLEVVLEGKVVSDQKVETFGHDQMEEVVLSVENRQDETVKILVVDDEPDIELLLRQQYLKKIRAGEWLLVFAENGLEALKIVEESPEIQIVLTDIQMPEMDGLVLLAKLNEMDRLIKTIVVSAYGDMQNIRGAMNKGAHDFLTKPIQFPDLERTIYKTIKNVRELQHSKVAQQRLIKLENEISLAKRIQQHVLPDRLPESDEVSVYAYMQPAREVNGDFYDFFYLDDDQLAFFIGDVSGKGISASFFMAMCRTLLKADARRGYPPADCMQTLNEFLYPEQIRDVFITVFYGILNTRTGELSYCNAGHNPPLLIDNNKEVSKVSWTGGIGIGVKKQFKYENASLTLDSSAGLLFYTDGLLKSRDKNNVLYDEKRLLNTVGKNAQATPSKIIRSIIRDLDEFAPGEEQQNDITLLAIRRTMDGV